jgi:dienelactone hydrolase
MACGTRAAGWLGAAALALLAARPAAAQPAEAAPSSGADLPGFQRDVTFDDYPAMAEAPELARRLLGPKAYRELQAKLAASGDHLQTRYLDLADERFALYVPKHRPPGGYGLIVFVPPWREAALPPGWGSVLEARGVIFVTAARSGNDVSVHRRRIPLALVAAANVAKRYELDPQRIYVAGFSGGGRTAERLALEFPDQFAGALLNAGSDPIGEAETPIPPAALFERFQTGARLVLVTGDRDEAGVGADATARSSFRAWCVAHVRQIAMMGVGHQAATGEALDEALKALDGGLHDPAAEARSERCRADLAARLATDVGKVRELRTSGAAPDAIAAETARVETRYGWPAAEALGEATPAPGQTAPRTSAHDHADKGGDADDQRRPPG